MNKKQIKKAWEDQSYVYIVDLEFKDSILELRVNDYLAWPSVALYRNTNGDSCNLRYRNNNCIFSTEKQAIKCAIKIYREKIKSLKIRYGEINEDNNSSSVF
jgi:hypothetical protein